MKRQTAFIINLGADGDKRHPDARRFLARLVMEQCALEFDLARLEENEGVGTVTAEAV